MKICEVFNTPKNYTETSYPFFDYEFEINGIAYIVGYPEIPKMIITQVDLPINQLYKEGFTGVTNKFFMFGYVDENGIPRESVKDVEQKDVFAVFSTLGEIIKNEVFGSYPPDVFFFGARNTERRKYNLYKRFAKMISKKTSYRYYMEYDDGETSYIFMTSNRMYIEVMKKYEKNKRLKKLSDFSL